MCYVRNFNLIFSIYNLYFKHTGIGYIACIMRGIAQQCDAAKRSSDVTRDLSPSQRHLVHVQKFQLMDNAVRPSQYWPTIVADQQRSVVS